MINQQIYNYLKNNPEITTIFGQNIYLLSMPDDYPKLENALAFNTEIQTTTDTTDTAKYFDVYIVEMFIWSQEVSNMRDYAAILAAVMLALTSEQIRHVWHLSDKFLKDVFVDVPILKASYNINYDNQK